MAQSKTKTQLQALDELCLRMATLLHATQSHLDTVAIIETTRETALVRTKVDEALMWLDRYHSGVLDELHAKRYE
ncbi:MAG: hypothetical protein K2J65_08060 [Duncaniella sp.]|nr:hypothetical protein [Duncaniella sp.]